MAIKWRSRLKEVPPEGTKKQVLAFSPAYPVGDAMRYRLLDGQFVGICKEVTRWIYVDELEPKETKP